MFTRLALFGKLVPVLECQPTRRFAREPIQELDAPDDLSLEDVENQSPVHHGMAGSCLGHRHRPQSCHEARDRIQANGLAARCQYLTLGIQSF